MLLGVQPVTGFTVTATYPEGTTSSANFDNVYHVLVNRLLNGRASEPAH